MKKAVVFLADGFEEIEALAVVDILRRAGVKCDTCSLKFKEVRGSHGITVISDVLFYEAEIDSYDAVVLPGGNPGAVNLRDDERVVEVVRKYYNEGRIVAAICAGPIVMEKAEILENKKVTSHPSVKDQLCKSLYSEDSTCEDCNIITSRGAGTAISFALHILGKLGLTEKASEINKAIMAENM